MPPANANMSKEFIRLTSGWIPVSVLLLFAAALVWGPVGASSREGSAPHSAPAAPVVAPHLLDPNERASLQSALDIADSVLPLADSIGLALGAAGQFAAEDIQHVETGVDR